MAQGSDKAEKKPRGPGRPFVKGQSGNPGGSSKAQRELRELFMDEGQPSFNRIKALAEGARNEVVKLKANELILAYVLGKPTQPIAGDPDRPPLGVSVDARAILSDPAVRAALDRVIGGSYGVAVESSMDGSSTEQRPVDGGAAPGDAGSEDR